VVNEPSIVAINKNTGEVERGQRGQRDAGPHPGNIVAIKPMKDGVIADFKVTERMLNYFIQKAHNRKMLVHPRIVIGVPSEITQVEKRAVMDSAYRAKASEVHLVNKPWWRPSAPDSRSPNPRAHGRGYRRRHHRRRSHFAFWHRLFPLSARGGQRNGRRHHAVPETNRLQ